MAKRRKKTPKVNRQPQPKKHPKAPVLFDSHYPLAWRLRDCDRGGKWAWTKLENPVQYKKVIERLQEFERKNWNEIISSGSHPIAVGDIVKSARDRLQKFKMDDIDELVSFRLSGKERVWCIRQLNVMKVMWWDPHHEICPAPKRDT